MAILGFVFLFLILLYILVAAVSVTYVSIRFGSKVGFVALFVVLADLYLFYLLFQHSPFTITML